MVQNLLNDTAGIEIPNCGISLSRKVRIKSCLHWKLDRSSVLKNDRGNPPLVQSLWRFSAPISCRLKPDISIKETLPASDSEAFFIIAGEALPRMRNFAGLSLRSAKTLRMLVYSGNCCTSSIMTRPFKDCRVIRGAADNCW
jgi:hypothetical protein